MLTHPLRCIQVADRVGVQGEVGSQDMEPNRGAPNRWVPSVPLFPMLPSRIVHTARSLAGALSPTSTRQSQASNRMVSALVHPSTLPDDGQWRFGQFPAVAASRVPYRGPRGLLVGKKNPEQERSSSRGCSVLSSLTTIYNTYFVLLLLPYLLTDLGVIHSFMIVLILLQSPCHMDGSALNFQNIIIIS